MTSAKSLLQQCDFFPVVEKRPLRVYVFVELEISGALLLDGE